MHQSYNLLKSVDVWTWGELQKQGFTDMKAMLTTTLALAHYDAIANQQQQALMRAALVSQQKEVLLQIHKDH